MKTAVAASRTSRAAGLALIGLFVLACSGAPAATQQGTAPTAGATPGGPVATAAAPDATPTVTTSTPAEPADTPAEPANTPAPAPPGSTPDVFGVVPPPASEDASATVQLGGQTYLFEARAVPDEAVPMCSLDFDESYVVVSLISADQRSVLSIFATYSGVGYDGTSFNVRFFSEERITEYWAPIEHVPFNVSGSTATWNGTMSEFVGTDREEQVAITIDCGG
ncbi:MAG TPA: hypothetical protein VMP67_06475 [Candidatus Limnocylindria bacterium]|nr:hypothetical protein [Candidatus Limnocylindria bacterium]